MHLIGIALLLNTPNINWSYTVQNLYLDRYYCKGSHCLKGFYTLMSQRGFAVLVIAKNIPLLAKTNLGIDTSHDCICVARDVTLGDSCWILWPTIWTNVVLSV